MSKDQSLPLEAIHSKDMSTFRAVMMTAHEARFINEQSNLGFIELTEKPTTISIQKLKEDKLAVVPKEEQGELF
jgi:DNA-directed RNA polymerase subunit K/omega